MSAINNPGGWGAIIYRARASSLGRLFDCAHAWEGANLLEIRRPGGIRALLGTAIHASTAAFDRSRIEGAGLTADDTAGVLVDTLRHPEAEVDLSDDSLAPDAAEQIGLSLHARYCIEVSPRYQWEAVELETTPLQIDCGGVVVELTGTLDRCRMRPGGGRSIADIKTGARAVEQGRAKTHGHAAQLGCYELLYEHTTGLPITAPAEVIGMKTSGKPEIATGEIVGAKALLLGWDDQPGLIQVAAEMFRSGMFPPNPQSSLCSPKYCPRWATCKYHY